MRWPFRGAASGLALLPLVAFAGMALGIAEGLFHLWGPRPPRGVPGWEGPDLVAYAALGAVTLWLPALVGALVAPRGPRTALAWVGLTASFPTAFIFFDHLVHERSWTHFALHSGGVPHLMRIVAVAAGLSLLALAIVWRPSMVWLKWLDRRGRCSAAAVGGIAGGLALLLLLLVELPAPSLPDKGTQRGAANVLLLTIDTLRRDAVGAYGGPPTPALDALLAQGVTTEGWAPAPWTRPSMAALLGNLSVTGTAAEGESGIFGDVPWWPQRLRDAGYVTWAIVCNPHLAARFGFDRGFDGFDHAGELERLAPIGQSVWARWLTRQIRGRFDPSRGDRIATRAERWLGGAPSLRAPWLLWVHLLDPHLPYHLRGPDGSLRDPDPPAWMADLHGDLEAGAFRDLEGAREGRRVTTPQAREALHRLYLREVGFVDHQVGRIVAAAQAASTERALVWIVASDHGEEFFEHGGFEHGHSLHGEVLRVPLAMGGLDLPVGARMGGMKLQDVGPTLLSLLGLDPPSWEEGSDLVEADSSLASFVAGLDRSGQMRAATPWPVGCEPPALVAEGMLYGPARTRLLWPDGDSLWIDESSGHLRRTDICLDPQEEMLQLVPMAQESERRLLQQLSAWRARLEDRHVDVGIDADLERQLKALGYLE